MKKTTNKKKTANFAIHCQPYQIVINGPYSEEGRKLMPHNGLMPPQNPTRHLQQYLKGQTDEDHLAAAAANIAILLDLEEQEK